MLRRKQLAPRGMRDDAYRKAESRIAYPTDGAFLGQHFNDMAPKTLSSSLRDNTSVASQET